MMPDKRKITYFISEILQQVKNADDDVKKIEILQNNESKYLKDILYANFSDHISWLVSDSPNYKINDVPIGMTDTNLFREIRRLYLYMAVHNIPCHKTLSQQKRDLMFCQVLSNMQKDESYVLVELSKKNLEKAFNLPERVVRSAFPNLLLSTKAKDSKENLSNNDVPSENEVIETDSSVNNLEKTQSKMPNKRGRKPNK